MREFKVGDRVAVYHSGSRYVSTLEHINEDGTLVFPGLSTCYSPQQCRRLKPKRVAREWWAGGPKSGFQRPTLFPLELEGENLAGQSETVTIGTSGAWTWFRVREVLPKRSKP